MNEVDPKLQLQAFWARYSPVERDGIPKYAALEAALSVAIADGFWERGAKLPTEAEIAQSSPYSLGTVQRAMRKLAEQGLIERRRRRGTYVPDYRRELSTRWQCRFLADDGQSFLPVFGEVINRSTTERQGPWSHPLNQEDEQVIQIERRIGVNSEFAIYSKFFIRADQFHQFAEMPLHELSGANLKVLVMQIKGAPLTSIQQQLRITLLPHYACKAIQVPTGTIGLHIQATAYVLKDVPVCYEELYIPPSERRLSFEIRI